MFLSGGDDLLEAEDVGGEGGHDDPAIRLRKDLPEGLAHLPLGQGMAGSFGIGAFRNQGQDTVVADLSDLTQVNGRHGGGSVVHLEVSGEE